AISGACRQPPELLADAGVAIALCLGQPIGADLDELRVLAVVHDRRPRLIIEAKLGVAAVGKPTPARPTHPVRRWLKALLKAAIDHKLGTLAYRDLHLVLGSMPIHSIGNGPESVG